MKEIVKGVALFLGGVLIGWGTSYYISAKKLEKKYSAELKKYAKYVDECIKNVEELTAKKEKTEETEEKKDISKAPVTYEKVIADLNKNAKERTDEPVDFRPRLVSVEEASDCSFPCLHFNWYNNGVLTDNHDNIVESPESFLGPDYEKEVSLISDTYYISAFFRKVFAISPAGVDYHEEDEFEEIEYGPSEDDDDEDDY